MRCRYLGLDFDVIQYDATTGRLHIRQTGHPTATIRRVAWSRVTGLSTAQREQLGITRRLDPVETMRRLLVSAARPQRADASFFVNDPIIDTEV